MEKKIESSFGFKVNATDKERTKVSFLLDFSKLEENDTLEYAAREVTRLLNAGVREGKIKVEEIQGQTIEVKKLESGRGKGKVSEEKALEALAALHGLSVEKLTEMLSKIKGAAK